MIAVFQQKTADFAYPYLALVNALEKVNIRQYVVVWTKFAGEGQ